MKNYAARKDFTLAAVVLERYAWGKAKKPRQGGVLSYDVGGFSIVLSLSQNEHGSVFANVNVWDSGEFYLLEDPFPDSHWFKLPPELSKKAAECIADLKAKQVKKAKKAMKTAQLILGNHLD
jgi:hypothetical protein